MSKTAKDIIHVTLLFGVIAAASWAAVFGISNQKRGIYGGHDWATARTIAQKQLAHKYGLLILDGAKMGVPNEAKTHLNDLISGGEQVRVLSIIGNSGVHYCVSISGASSSIKKGCTVLPNGSVRNLRNWPTHPDWIARSTP